MRVAASLIGLLVATEPLMAQETVPARLAGHAVLPPSLFSVPPRDAPRDAFVTGKFLDPGARVDRPGTFVHSTGFATPFLGQPVQGFSGYAATRGTDGALLALIDNGFGAKLNSPDVLLSFTRLLPDFETGEIAVVERVWLHDPDRRVPFRIVNESTEARYLTGSDFDPESIQLVGEEVWIGEEFGPYLISATLDGRITGVYPTELGGELLRSPDHPALRVGVEPGRHWRVPRSGGFEGMALKDGRLWAMLEKPILTQDGNPEGDFLRIMVFDPIARSWTDDSLKFRLAEGAVAIGDFNMVDEDRALVIERDHGQGDPALACADVESESCFPDPARVKRVTLIDLADVDPDGFVRKLRQIDLMNIDDPDRLALHDPGPEDRAAGRFMFPFVTIESVILDGPDHILVSNDNNLPFSTGRNPTEADWNEIIRLYVPELLAD